LRAFERDKDVLREMGVPLVLEAVDPVSQPGVEGYRIPKDEYYLQDPGLDPDELAALHLAASAVELEGGGGVEALWKLGGWVAEEGPPPAMAALPGASHLSPAFAAISRRQPVTFTYRGEQRRAAPRRRRPRGLGCRSGRGRRGGDACRRRFGRAQRHRDQPQRVPLVRPWVSRPRRGTRSSRAARRRDLLAGAAVRRVTEPRTGR